MAVVLSYPATGGQVILGAVGDITVHVYNEAATITQIQAALTAISAAIGGMGSAGATIAQYDGVGGNP